MKQSESAININIIETLYIVIFGITVLPIAFFIGQNLSPFSQPLARLLLRWFQSLVVQVHPQGSLQPLFQAHPFKFIHSQVLQPPSEGIFGYFPKSSSSSHEFSSFHQYKLQIPSSSIDPSSSGGWLGAYCCGCLHCHIECATSPQSGSICKEVIFGTKNTSATGNLFFSYKAPRVLSIAQCVHWVWVDLSLQAQTFNWQSHCTGAFAPDACPIIAKLPVKGLYINCGWGTGGFKATPGSGWAFAHTVARDEPHELNAAFTLERFISGALIDEHGAAGVAH